MKILLRFTNGSEKIKEIPTESPPPQIMWHQTDPEIHQMILSSPEGSRPEMLKKYGEHSILFIKTETEENGIPIYYPTEK